MKTYAMTVQLGEFTKTINMTAKQLSVTEEYMDKVVADHVKKIQPKCCSCGTTKGIFKDGWYGYRCRSNGCAVF